MKQLRFLEQQKHYLQTKRRNFIEHTSNILFTEERETLWLAACAAVLFQTRIHLLLVVIALYIWLPSIVYALKASLKVNMLVILAYCFFCVFQREHRRVTAIIRVSRLPMVLICCFWYKSSSNGKLAKQQTSFLDYSIYIYTYQFEQKYNTNYRIHSLAISQMDTSIFQHTFSLHQVCEDWKV